MMGPGGMGMGAGSGSGPRPPGPRAQGPPPPYHQTPRSASVPIAAPSPTPGSPNNPTSNLSLPSPRTSSGLNSPAEPSRSTGGPNNSTDSPSASRSHNPSNPGTPVSCTPTHMSPPANRKEESPHTGNNAQPPQQSPGTVLDLSNSYLTSTYCVTVMFVSSYLQMECSVANYNHLLSNNSSSNSNQAKSLT